ncbi:hypothetical protein Tco_0905271 [Tanacetum coccineum]
MVSYNHIIRKNLRLQRAANSQRLHYPPNISATYWIVCTTIGSISACSVQSRFATITSKGCNGLERWPRDTRPIDPCSGHVLMPEEPKLSKKKITLKENLLSRRKISWKDPTRFGFMGKHSVGELKDLRFGLGLKINQVKARIEFLKSKKSSKVEKLHGRDSLKMPLNTPNPITIMTRLITTASTVLGLIMVWSLPDHQMQMLIIFIS